MVPLERGTPAGPRYSTAELLAMEARLVERAHRQLHPRLRPVGPDQIEPALADRPTLSDEQRRMVAALTTSAAAVQVVVGRAGTGKTFALDAARAVWEAAGRPVIGAALAARAAAELQAGAGIPATSLDRLLTDLDRPGPLSGLPYGSVVVVDEAAMVGTRKLACLLDHTLRADASLVLVGDHRQLPEIEAGGAFAALAGRVPTVELTHNRRQHLAWERDALADLRAGSVGDAVAAYHRQGRIVMAATAEGIRDRMVDDWWTARQAGEQGGMYALRRADVDDLNRRARQRLQAAGLIGAAQMRVDGRPFAVGDQIICLRNDRRLGVRNGTVATITAVHPDAGEISLDNGVRLPGPYLAAGHVAHAYATTIHKA